MEKRDVSQLIPFDLLHWNSEEKKYVPLSEDELDKIIEICINSGIETLDGTLGVIRWAEHIRLGSILYERLMDGKLSISYVDPEDGPKFFAKNP